MTNDAAAVVALAGRRPDPPDAETPRFPLDRAVHVRSKLREALSRPGARALVASAAAGADLLGLDVARELNLRRRIVLPFSPEEFRETSVADRPGPWPDLYDGLIAEATEAGDLVILEGDSDESAYREVNEAILSEAEALARPGGEVRAVIVWEGGARPGDDLTAAFRRSAERRGMPIEEVLTGVDL